MKVGKYGHLTYCTNIHSAQTWPEVFRSLEEYVMPLKKNLSPNEPFGIGLRLSNEASCDLIKESELRKFKLWLDQNQLYVFTINGFPYGGFHGQVVKDKVHIPDWTTTERVAYTLRLAKILCFILPEGMEGGISTSPISYEPWLEDKGISKERVLNISCGHLFQLVEELIKIRKTTGKIIHIDIEPEPDGLIENAEELIELFKFYLIPEGKEYLANKLKVSSYEARELIKTHIQACYDVCHHAVAYENSKEVFEKYKKAGIKIGKIQLSAALKVLLESEDQRIAAQNKLKVFEESTYLHQVIERKKSNSLEQYTDLPFALPNLFNLESEEWRIHFHVPLFVEDYGLLKSTQSDIIEVLEYHKSQPITQHLEVETYTWEVLPSDLKLSLSDSIQRELEWVLKYL